MTDIITFRDFFTLITFKSLNQYNHLFSENMKEHLRQKLTCKIQITHKSEANDGCDDETLNIWTFELTALVWRNKTKTVQSQEQDVYPQLTKTDT